MILYYFPQFDFEKLRRLSPFQMAFLIEWLVWFGLVKKDEV